MSSAIHQVRQALWTALAPQLPATFGMACSGGADSLVLVDAARAVLGPAAVVVLHIDHGLAPDSARVASAVVEWARAQGLVAVVRRVEVARQASLEQAARRARYQALDQLADELGLVAVATAHTARDQAETVLMRVLRGAGVAGISGIAGRRGRYVRPLLALPRSTVEAYAQALRLPIWDDPMNTDPRFLRSRIRHQVMPRLAQENPAIEQALCRLADSAGEWLEVIDQLAEPLSHQLTAAALAAAAPAVRKRAFACALIRLGLGFDAEHLDALDRLMAGPARGTVQAALPGVTAVREYDRLRLELHRERAVTVLGAPTGQGETGQGEATPAPEEVPAPLADPERFAVRSPAPGDRMRPARLHGRSRKLSDLFVDAKVPRRWRASAKVVCRRSDGVIVWVQHLGFAHEAG